MGKSLTAASVESAKPVAGKQVEYGDGKQPGLALRVSPAGKKSWTLRYRTQEGRQRRLTLGRYPSVSLSQARDLARKSIGYIAEGEDPAKEKKAAKVAAKSRQLSTLDTLIESYFEDSSKGRHKPNARPKRQSTLKLERDFYEREIKPRLGSVPIEELTRHDIQQFLDKIGERAPSSARHCRDVIRQAYNYAIRREVAEKNPAQLVEVPRAKPRDRVLTDDEIRSIWSGAADPVALESLQMTSEMGLVIQLAMVTLQRGSEVIGIHAEEIDRERKLWTIPGSRTKNHHTHVVPLSGLAVHLLDQAFMLAAINTPTEQPTTNDWRGYAFPSPDGTGSMTRHALTRASKRLTTALKVEDVRPHDFRRTGTTNITGERIGIPRFIVSRVLNQMSDTGGAAAVTGVYDRNEYLSEKRRALEAWSRLFHDIITDKKRVSNVVRLETSIDAI